MNEDLKLALDFKERLLKFIDLLLHDDILTDDEYQKTRKYFLKKYLEEIPVFLKECRTLQDFINKLRTVASWDGSWQARREFITNSFKDFLDFLEFGIKKDDVIKKEFLDKEFEEIDFNRLGFDEEFIFILEKRIEEIKKGMELEIPLSTIILIASTLEGILCGLANKYPEEFNRARSAPKDISGKPRKFNDWKFAEYIEVAEELSFINRDVKEFGDKLRDFRNYIHPCYQMKKDFYPNADTVKICWQVFKAALIQIYRKIKERANS